MEASETHNGITFVGHGICPSCGWASQHPLPEKILIPTFELNTGTQTVSDTLNEFRKSKVYQTTMENIKTEMESEASKGCSTCEENPDAGPCPPDCRPPSWKHWARK